MTNYLSGGKPFQLMFESNKDLCELYGKQSSVRVCIYAPSALFLLPYWVWAWFRTSWVCLSYTRISRWCTQVLSSPAAEGSGQQLAVRGHGGHPLMRFHGSRRALKCVRGLRMRPRLPLGYCDPWHPFTSLSALFCDLQILHICGVALAISKPIQIIYLDTGYSEVTEA